MLLTVASPGTFKPVAILCAISSAENIRNKDSERLSCENLTWLRKSILGPEERQDQGLLPEPSHDLHKHPNGGDWLINNNSATARVSE